MLRLLLPLVLCACAGPHSDAETDDPCEDAWRDGDGDGFGAGEAGAHCELPSGWARRDGDCDDGDQAVFPGAVELCDGVDGDCDGLDDADDGCTEGACDDGLDGDFDGWVDCADEDCDGQCPEVCGDGRDNDGDGAVDCADEACFAEATCVEVDCSDTLDNEGDGLVDCADSDCWAVADCGPWAMGVHAGTMRWGQTEEGDVAAAFDVRGQLVRGDMRCGFEVDELEVEGGVARRTGVRVEAGCGVTDGRFLPQLLVVSDGALLAEGAVWIAGYEHDRLVSDEGQVSAVVDPIEPQVPLGDCGGSDPSWRWSDADGDGYGDPRAPLLSCDGVGVGNADDCDDDDDQVEPGATEVCDDGLDNNCDGDRGACAGLSGRVPLGDAEFSLVGQAGNTARRVRAAGDLDGDGLADLLVGVPQHGGAGANAGALVWVPAAELSSGPLDDYTVVLGLGAEDYAAGAVAAPGDLTGDGVPDVVAGATGVLALDGSARGGAVYVLAGPLVDGDMGDAAATIEAPTALWLGAAVDGVGDLTGEGTAWLAVGAQTSDGGGASSGAVYLFQGPLAGALSPADAQAIWVGDNSDIVGDAVAGLGDVDGDGRPDVLVGHRKEDWGAPDAGAARLLLAPGEGGDLADADVSWFGDVPYQWAGRVVAAAGDTNGDGYRDMLVGAQDTAETAPVPWAMRGEAYLLLGGPALAGGELADADAVFLGERVWDEAGMALSGGHDVDGDGLHDMLVGAHGDDDAGWYSGAAYLLHGGVSGLVDLSEADAKLVGRELGDMAGSYGAIVGDVDGDGFADVAVGARAFDGGTDGGRVDVLLGGPGW